MMKSPHRGFRLSDWYGEDWDHKKKSQDDDLWVSPWAKAHYKLRQQEIEIERCELLLEQAIAAEDYGEADGLKERAERLRSQHPIVPREDNLMQAILDENFALAMIFQNDLDQVKKNLGLPKYSVGQAVVHCHRTGMRGVVLDVDLQCVKGRDWVREAGCLERGCALGYPGDETEWSQLLEWTRQPFYTVLLDLADKEDQEAKEKGVWRWGWPSELAAWEVETRGKLPAPVYLAEDALTHDQEQERPMTHPDLWQLFAAYAATPHRGRIYRPAPRLRLWQQKRQKELQEAMRTRRAFDLNSKNPYDVMKVY